MSIWVLGVDPSASKNTESACIGWALFRDGQFVSTGELTPDPPFFTRVRQWTRNKFKVIQTEDENPEITVGVETVYLGVNPNVFLGLIQCQSHICAVTLDAGYSFRFVSPLESFQAATGYRSYRGKGTRKNDIRAAVIPRYSLSDETSEHEIDAVAIAEAILKRHS